MAVNIPYPQPAQLWNDGIMDEATDEASFKKIFNPPSSLDSSTAPILASASTSSLDSTFNTKYLPDSNVEMHFAWCPALVFIGVYGVSNVADEISKTSICHCLCADVARSCCPSLLQSFLLTTASPGDSFPHMRAFSPFCHIYTTMCSPQLW